MMHTKLIVDKMGKEHSSIVEQLSGYTVFLLDYYYKGKLHNEIMLMLELLHYG